MSQVPIGDTLIHFIGLGIGTTGCKAAIFHATGKLLASASREYAADLSRPNLAEQDTGRVWQLAQDALRDVIAAAGPEDIAALGLSVRGEEAMPVDAQGRAQHPAILGTDMRTGEQNAWLRDESGAERLFEHMGMPVHTIDTLPKLLWLRQHEPDLWARAERFLLYEDFHTNRMAGQTAVSRCLASRTQSNAAQAAEEML